ncbi:MAG: RimK family alpha-L-glutamate ligase [Erysipelotrichaceae bacterium]
MKGLFIINGFINSNKFNEMYDMLIHAFKFNHIQLDIMTNDQVLFCYQNFDNNTYDFVLFWDKDIMLAQLLEAKGLRLINSSDAINFCDDKRLTVTKLQNSHIKMPKSIIAPFTYNNIGYTNLDFLDEVEKVLGYPLVLKVAKSSFGMGVFLVDDKKTLKELTIKYFEQGILYQEYIASSYGKDVRIQIVNNEVVACVLRINDNDFRSNVTNGGKMFNFNPNDQFKDMATDVCQILGVKIGGVDIMFDENNNPIFCEINSNAHFKNLYEATKINVAELIVKYIVSEFGNINNIVL